MTTNQIEVLQKYLSIDETLVNFTAIQHCFDYYNQISAGDTKGFTDHESYQLVFKIDLALTVAEDSIDRLEALKYKISFLINCLQSTMEFAHVPKSVIETTLTLKRCVEASYKIYADFFEVLNELETNFAAESFEDVTSRTYHLVEPMMNNAIDIIPRDEDLIKLTDKFYESYFSLMYLC